MITKRIVKSVVETFSGIEDISRKTRKREYVDARAVYYKLCRTLILEDNASTIAIGKAVGYDHATVLHGLRLFEEVGGSRNFTANETYRLSFAKLKSMQENTADLDNFLSVKDLKNYYLLQHIKLTDKSHKVINMLLNKLELLSGNELIKKLLTLNADELEEAEEKMSVFFKVKESMRQKKSEKVKEY